MLKNIEHARYLVVDNQRVALQSIVYQDETLLFAVASQANSFYKMMDDIQAELNELLMGKGRFSELKLIEDIMMDVDGIKENYGEYLKNMLSKSAILIEFGLKNKTEFEYLKQYQELFNVKINAFDEKISAVADAGIMLVKKDADMSISVFAIFSTLLLLMTIVVVYWINAYFIKPLSKASQFVESYSFDKLESASELVFDGDNEIGKLTMNIRKMLEKLHATTVTRDKLELAVTEIEKANAAKSEFLGSMSHEFRTPLNAIIGFSDLLMGEQQDEQQKQFLTGIKQAGLEILDMTDNIIDASKYQAGQVDFYMEDVGVYKIINECLLSARMASIKNSIKIIAHDEKDEVYVKFDSAVLRHAINNFIMNAIKYNNKGGEVNVYVSHESDNKIRINVKDDGLGISEENQSKLFEPFQRLDFTNSNIRGTGLGLYVTKNRIECLGGVVGFSSKQGQGSLFWIELSKNMISESDHNIAS